MRIARFFAYYFYCDIQAAAHFFMRAFGLTLQRDPELYLRLLSMLSFAATVAVTYFVARRQDGAWWSNLAPALAIGASPLLLFYAFEARLSAFATLGVIVYLALLTKALVSDVPKRLRVAGALLGIVLGHLHVYIAFLFAGLCIAAVIRYAISRDRRELLTIAAFALPGGITTAAEVAFITFTYPTGGAGFPLYAAQPWRRLLSVTVSVISSTGLSAPPAILYPISVALFATTVVLAIFALRRSPHLVVPVAATLALVATVVSGATHGFMIAPRYQMPLFGALLFSFALAASKQVRICVAILAAFELQVLPTTIRDVSAKGNGRAIARLIQSAPRNDTAIVIQHSLRLGYPDPLHSAVLPFYLNELHPKVPPLRLYELPALRDITTYEGVRDYFGGGAALLQSYAAIPEANWHTQLTASPWRNLWLITPVPRAGIEARQSAAFRAALERNGFKLRRAWLFSGYPMTQVGLFTRSDRHDPSAVLHFLVEHAPDLSAVDKARDEDGHRTPSQ